MTNKKGLVGVISLGCDKNRVDSEIMLYNLSEYGFELTDKPELADAIIVNTCAFLESARKEAIDTILEMAAFKKHGKCKVVAVTGCLGSKFGAELHKHLKEADVILGITQYDDIGKIIEQQLLKKSRQLCSDQCFSSISQGKRILTTDKHFAYLKIADGCNNFCSYCLIPHIRGRYRSRSMESILDEATELAENGVREIILVAQDVTRYGEDLYKTRKLVELVTQLSKIQKIKWIRLMYCYPELVDDELIETISTNGKVVKYIDIPLQHVDDTILRLMNRRSNFQQIVTLFDKLKCRNIQARTTFICGFPSETAQTQQKIADFLEKYQLLNVGFFAFSREEGTKAFEMQNQVSQKDKEMYVQNLYALQQKIVNKLNAQQVGKVFLTVIDRLVQQNADGFVYAGRTQYMCPEIDGTVFVHSKTALQAGQFCNVEITQAIDYDLLGDVVD